MEKEYLAILLEEMNSKFQLVLEGMALIDKKLTERDLPAFEIQVLAEKIEAIKDCLKAPENKLINLCRQE